MCDRVFTLYRPCVYPGAVLQRASDLKGNSSSLIKSSISGSSKSCCSRKQTIFCKPCLSKTLPNYKSSLFIIFYRDLPAVSTSKTAMFADDTLIHDYCKGIPATSSSARVCTCSLCRTFSWLATGQTSGKLHLMPVRLYTCFFVDSIVVTQLVPRQYCCWVQLKFLMLSQPDT